MPNQSNKNRKLSALRVAAAHMNLHMDPLRRLNARKLTLAHKNISNTYWNTHWKKNKYREIIYDISNAITDGELSVRQVPRHILRRLVDDSIDELTPDMYPEDQLYVIKKIGDPIKVFYERMLSGVASIFSSFNNPNIEQPYNSKILQEIIRRASSKSPSLLTYLVAFWFNKFVASPPHFIYFVRIISKMPKSTFRKPKIMSVLEEEKDFRLFLREYNVHDRPRVVARSIRDMHLESWNKKQMASRTVQDRLLMYLRAVAK
jgi:hypothetical protein